MLSNEVKLEALRSIKEVNSALNQVNEGLKDCNDSISLEKSKIILEILKTNLRSTELTLKIMDNSVAIR